MSLAPALPGTGPISLQPLLTEHVTQRYVDWLNDYQVMRYTEARYMRHSIDSTICYVKINLADPDAMLWRIVESDLTHIGNLRLSGLSSPHKRGDIALIIGEPSCWGKGYGPAAIHLASEFAFRCLHLHKITAGAYAINEASSRAFIKCGFSIEALLPQHYFFEGQFIDGIIMGLTVDQEAP